MKFLAVLFFFFFHIVLLAQDASPTSTCIEPESLPSKPVKDLAKREDPLILKRENEEQFLLSMDFMKSKVKNVKIPTEVKEGTFITVTYIHSICKNSFYDQQRLDKERRKELLRIFPTLENNLLVEWKEKKYESCGEKENTSDKFHGFAINYRQKPSGETWKKEKEILFGKKPEISVESRSESCVTVSKHSPQFQKDEIVSKVLERKKEWNGAIVGDLTGSMFPYTQQLFLYFKLQTLKRIERAFVFFNDGDRTPDEKKVTGKTGGIYFQKLKNYEELEKLAKAAISGGYGGDSPENDIEALIKAQAVCPECKELILIADNFSNMRDYSLMSQIQKPVRVVLCGSYAGINTEYLDLARITKGSVHTIEEDLENLMELNEGQIIELNKKKYVLEKGRFKPIQSI
ncbi:MULTISPECIES: hypothetical protein [unclassified Leptospira]|uniref:hypothetical protein n=1 Tax=unclassified Leptospira TaxID=2633828 RepID=UPI0002BFD980|nr:MULTISPECIES: hypothetical protein [unclassified Leptospira]EMJ99981.1 hypothetical protein LEP1GSC192_1048 [Leptospira sp. B5-022]MCR1794526.1 hypothetical protein [Leptospira sp. id769339]